MVTKNQLLPDDIKYFDNFDNPDLQRRCEALPHPCRLRPSHGGWFCLMFIIINDDLHLILCV